ncbi:MAG: hypothetical protein EBX56_02355 [Betaproteobacteria bacterium]|nr:hypothetical protein [Betaproteobacteria bacterium]
MKSLQDLKFVHVDRRVPLTPREVRRIKLCRKVEEQLRMAQAAAEGSVFNATRLKRVLDPSTGERVTKEVPKRMKPWWWQSESGRLCLSVRYGSKVIEVVKGRNAIEAANFHELIGVLETIRTAASSISPLCQQALQAACVHRFHHRSPPCRP